MSSKNATTTPYPLATVQAADGVRELMANMRASDVTAVDREWTASDLLATGTRLGLWRFITVDPATSAYLVRINGRDQMLLPVEVRGWVLGVIHALDLPVEPFRYRDGLDPL